MNQPGLDFYDSVVDELTEAGITPVFVIYAWEMPAAPQDLGGWASRDSTEWFAEFASVLCDRLGDRVGYWLTICEPLSIAHYGHTAGALAPGLKDIYTGLRVPHHLMVGNGRVVQAFRASSATGKIGVIHGLADIKPATPISRRQKGSATISTPCSWTRSCSGSTRADGGVVGRDLPGGLR